MHKNGEWGSARLVHKSFDHQKCIYICKFCLLSVLWKFTKRINFENKQSLYQCLKCEFGKFVLEGAKRILKCVCVWSFLVREMCNHTFAHFLRENGQRWLFSCHYWYFFWVNLYILNAIFPLLFGVNYQKRSIKMKKKSVKRAGAKCDHHKMKVRTLHMCGCKPNRACMQWKKRSQLTLC